MNPPAHIDGSSRLDPLAEVAKTLGHPHRLALLEQIVRGERSVEKLAELTGITVANASQHLQHLKRAGCVQTRRDGKHMLYRLGPGPLASVVVALHDYVEFQHSRIREAIADSRQRPQEMESVSIDGLLDRMDEGAVVLLDIRGDEEFAQAHLPGAINIPLEQLADRIGELSRDTEVVAYCRGPYCVLSMQAVSILQAHGMQATPLAGGVPEWRAAGLALQGSTGPVS
ncbi:MULTISPECIES: ArsR/SmtB family transcription factor [Pseudomonadota]|jgi:rhodanese-related sulfurtransferase/biotin operon repressor|uniref:Metalloregulator ArsR/SmtB family transcription factor n=5 Tax=Pseudomonadota TaxID=1224 RepID=A0A7Y1F8D2_PSEVE|nr:MULTISPECIES: metalloregulator ArsR/SmtB family transcription factor [Pseudomonadota]ABM41580.1 transcriptional regulator, ArsR family [Acidovorax sp. JS42]AOY65856.1 ArsR family transcriptional regulator [Xanthomonas euvesicatoria pv. vesicatoria str. 85-10]AQQ19620.1 ArsR family transcriptional regulator [Burkholderia cenocepacia]KLB39772.1 ArsR family transcriptional regulator [Xanthomonas euvesicatoria]MCC8578017.1 metalloregulator ArsR/SmtB family transcription factor [Xanthomonas euve